MAAVAVLKPLAHALLTLLASALPMIRAGPPIVQVLHERLGRAAVGICLLVHNLRVLGKHRRREGLGLFVEPGELTALDVELADAGAFDFAVHLVSARGRIQLFAARGLELLVLVTGVGVEVLGGLLEIALKAEVCVQTVSLGDVGAQQTRA